MTTTAAAAPTASAVLASFGTSFELADVEPRVVEKVKVHLLDTLGAAIAGAASREAAAARTAYLATGGERTGARLWGTPLRERPATAALLNGIAAHALELDDSDGCDHSGAVVVPAVLAAASLRPASGADIVRATLLGYEVARRVMDASGGYAACNAAGWHSTGTCGSFGAAAAAAAVLRLDEREHAWALGLAGSFTGGVWAFIDDGAMSKRLHAGRAAENGLTSAALARAGFTGPLNIFEAEWGGYFSTYVPATASPPELVAALGETWRVSQASIKPHASCRDTHSAVDVVLDHPELDPASVDAIVVRTSALAARMCGGTDVTTMVDAQMSMPHCIAAALLHGRVGLTEIGADVRADPRVRDLVRRTHVEADHRADGEPPALTFHLVDGSARTFQGTAPLGSTGRPMSTEQIVRKFSDLAGRALPSDRVAALVETTLTLERRPDASELLELLGADPLPPALL